MPRLASTPEIAKLPVAEKHKTSVLLLTEATLTDLPEPSKEAPSMGPGMD